MGLKNHTKPTNHNNNNNDKPNKKTQTKPTKQNKNPTQPTKQKVLCLLGPNMAFILKRLKSADILSDENGEAVVYMSNEKKTYHPVPAVNKTRQLSPLYLIKRERKAKQ